jgi:hypothetical protein
MQSPKKTNEIVIKAKKLRVAEGLKSRVGHAPLTTIRDNKMFDQTVQSVEQSYLD